MPFAQQQAVAVRIEWRVRADVHGLEIKGGQQLGGRRGPTPMSRSPLVQNVQHVEAKLLGQPLQLRRLPAEVRLMKQLLDVDLVRCGDYGHRSSVTRRA